MYLVRISLIGLFLAGAAGAAAGQDRQTVDVTRLGLDLSKIQRDLRQSASTQSENHGLKVRYTVDVYGQAPRIEFFTKEDNLQSGPVPFSAPTHQEWIDAVTPIEYRAPAADLSNLFRWLSERANKK
jgi:hypothetical protein